MTTVFELWVDNTTGTVSSPATAGDSTISVATLTGAFPVPSTNQVFHIVVDFATDQAETVTVSANASGVFTIANSGILAFDHLVGATVACTLTAEGLKTLVPQNGDIGFFGTTPIAQKGPATGWTVAQVITALQDYGLLS